MTVVTQPLDQWEVLDFDPGSGSAEGGVGWMAISAPGDVYQTLVREGRLAHPYEGQNEAAAVWVRDREWWQRTTFVAPDAGEGETVELVFEGLDTFATIYLDGELVGQTDNMFRPWAFPITDRVKSGQTHSLAVCFQPTALALEGRPPPPPWAAFTDRISRSKRNLMRKAQFGWGWDWGPDLPTVGIWQAARIEVRPRARIAELTFTTLSATSDGAQVRIALGGGGDLAGLRTDIRLEDPDGLVIFQQDRDAADTTPINLTLEAPRLWWTHDLGAQPLYRLSVRLLDGDRVLDEQIRSVGIRTIELDQSHDPDEPGATFFRFVINGVPIFAKGACWVPTTSFVGDVASEPYERLIDQAARANMNMIRVWGGGIYEPDQFYDLCDQQGVLVWQDFMFACAPYPDDEAFAASVAAEVDYQVRRLRHHPSMALWCGNNENQAIHRINVDVSGVDTPLPGAALYDELIPDILSRLDPTTPYWPGSPWGGPNPNSMKAGDVHDWTVWHGVPPIPGDHMIEPFGYAPDKIVYQRYAEDTARFVSEFGIQAAPALATLKRWMDSADLSPESVGFEQRIKDEAKKAWAMIKPVTGLPRTLQDYIDFTQWTQAEGLKFGIEHFRRRRPHCSGALLWQFNDCWPCVSWSLVDYDGVEKAAYHAVRRAFAPVLASFRQVGDQVEVWLTNDALVSTSGEAVITLETLGGVTLWREAVFHQTATGAHSLIWRGLMPTSPDQVMRVWSPDATFPPNRLFAAPIQALPLNTSARPELKVKVSSPNRLQLTLIAPQDYLPFVHAVSDRADISISDNFFDLAGRQSHTILIEATHALSPEEVQVRCWNDRGWSAPLPA